MWGAGCVCEGVYVRCGVRDVYDTSADNAITDRGEQRRHYKIRDDDARVWVTRR